MPDEITADGYEDGDDGAIQAFWEWFAKLRGRHPNLSDPAAFLATIESYESSL